MRCNLQCRHCYSSSGPARAAGLPAGFFLARLQPLAEHGYRQLSLSGGEPLLYPDLYPLIDAARGMGFSVSLITNGGPVDAALASWLAQREVTVAVSVDGAPAWHDELRGRHSHSRAMRGLALLRDAGVVVGMAHCVTRASMGQLPALLARAERERVALLQLHPLVGVGRGDSMVPAQALSQPQLLRLAVLAGVATERYRRQFSIQLDLATGSELIDCIRPQLGAAAGRQLSELYNPVVLDQRGVLYPGCFGLDRRWALAEGSSEAFARAGAGQWAELGALAPSAGRRLRCARG